MRHLKSRASVGALLSAVALLVSSAVQAQITPRLFNVVDNGAGECEFQYSIDLGPDAQLTNTAPGDFGPGSSYFTIYDFVGYVAGSEFAPADWEITIQNVGVTPSGVDPGAFTGDNPNIVNITFHYTGPETNGPATGFQGEGAFGASSTLWATTVGTYSEQTEQVSNNLRHAGGGFVDVPAVPEASSLMLLVPGLVPLGVMLRRRARK